MAGTWTFDAVNNIETVTGATVEAPAGFVDAWDADVAGTRTLRAAAASPFTGSLTTAVKPTEKLALKLSAVITAHSVNGTVAFTGKDAWGNAINETLNVTGNGTYTTTLYFASMNANGVVAVGTFSVEVTQPRWGVVWKQGTNQFMFDCKISIGNTSTATYFADNLKQIVFSHGVITANSQVFISVTNNAQFTLGILADAATKRTMSGVTIFSLERTYYCHLIRPQSNTALIYLYGCSFFGGLVEAWWQAIHAYNINCNGRAYPHISVYTSAVAQDYNNVIVSGEGAVGGSANGIRRPNTGTTITNLFITVPSAKVWFQSSAGTVKNVYWRGPNISVRMENVASDCFIINADDGGVAWTFSWLTSAGKLFRKYEFDLTTEPSATVTLKDAAGNTALYLLVGGTWTAVDSVVADASGVIATHNFRLQYYNQANGNVPVCTGPWTLKITKVGKMPYEKVLDIPVDPVTGYYNPTSAFKLQVKLRDQLSGDASVGDVAAGKKFYKDDADTQLTGTLTQNAGGYVKVIKEKSKLEEPLLLLTANLILQKQKSM